MWLNFIYNFCLKPYKIKWYLWITSNLLFLIINVINHIFSNQPHPPKKYPKYTRMLLHKCIFLYSVRTTLFSWNSASKYYTPQGYHHPFTYTEAQDNIQKHSFGLTAYKLNIVNMSLSYECSLENVTNTGAVMYFNPSAHSAIVLIQFFILLQLPCPGKIIMKSIGIVDYIKITNPALSGPLAL